VPEARLAPSRNSATLVEGNAPPQQIRSCGDLLYIDIEHDISSTVCMAPREKFDTTLAKKDKSRTMMVL
jgi:hypothetical protein